MHFTFLIVRNGISVVRLRTQRKNAVFVAVRSVYCRQNIICKIVVGL
jgi:hypothetical protein